jgi:hypothetical protein
MNITLEQLYQQNSIATPTLNDLVLVSRNGQYVVYPIQILITFLTINSSQLIIYTNSIPLTAPSLPGLAAIGYDPTIGSKNPIKIWNVSTQSWS